MSKYIENSLVFVSCAKKLWNTRMGCGKELEILHQNSPSLSEVVTCRWISLLNSDAIIAEFLFFSSYVCPIWTRQGFTSLDAFYNFEILLL